MPPILQYIVPKRGMTCLHLISQFGHVGLLHTMLRIASKANMSKFVMMFDRWPHSRVCMRLIIACVIALGYLYLSICYLYFYLQAARCNCFNL
jgi:hypothetical protein